MIVTEDLSKKFKDFLAVNRVNLRVEPGEVLALLGPNGAGKTTTIRMLTSVLRPTSGKAYVAGYDVLTQPELVRASVGVLTEQHGLYNRMPAGEYLDFFGSLYGMDRVERGKRISELLTDFGLKDVVKKRIGEFSKGMRQKLALARALIHNPPVLLLDEPTSAMDPESARLVRDSIKDLRSEERTIVICTHNLAEAEELADKIAIIRDGQIIAQGTPQRLKELIIGAFVYELRFWNSWNGSELNLPDDVHVIEQGKGWFRYEVKKPEQTNPELLRTLLQQGVKVLSLQEVNGSLEQVYLRAVNAPDVVGVLDAA